MTTRLFVLLGALAASSSQAAWPTLAASAGYESQIFTSQAWELVDTNDFLPMLRVGASTSFEVGRGFLDVGLSFTTGASRESAHAGQVATELWLRGVELSGLYRYPVLKWLEPYAQVGVGWDWVTLTLVQSSRLSQTVSNVAGSGLLGVQLPVRMGLGGGRLPFMVFDVGGGYVLRPDYAFTAMAPVSSELPESIPDGAVNLGQLPMHGWVWRVLVSLRW
ncbi:MAG: hypothetical protein IT380_14765 [Myxococcales bacterium]|nr:hypothetical protein [Myxococcales bacterium]